MSDDVAETSVPKQLRAFAWSEGQSGNPKGRPKGVRHKLDDAFVRALYEDFKEGGVDAIRTCRAEKPDVYLNVIAKVLPKRVDVTADESVADLANGLHAVADFLSSFAAETVGADPAGALSDGSVLSSSARSQTH